MSRILAITLVGGLLAGSAAAQGVDFFATAAASNHKEVEMAKVARTRARHDSVKAFASRLVSDHMKSNRALMALASVRNAAPPRESGDDSSIAVLTAASADEFDRTFITQMIQAHTAAVALFESQAKDGTDGQLQAFAQKQLPVLREHLAEARRIQGTLLSR